jgi:glycosyltransferase involved in cell wall biosynthesis
MSEKVTFVLFTFNEEVRLSWFIKNFSGKGQLLIVDNESTDRTVEIAKAAGCEVLINKNKGWVEDEITTARVKQVVKTDWIYWGFADEMIKPKALDHLLAVIDSEKYDVIRLMRKNFYYGKFCGNVRADVQTKFFKKDAIDFKNNRIHEFGKIIVPPSRIYLAPSDVFIGHFMDDNISSYLSKMDKYTDIEVERYGSEVNVSIVALILYPFKTFVFNYIFKRRFGSDFPGFTLLLAQIFYFWLIQIKIFEKKNNIKRSDMENAYQQEKHDFLRLEA